MSTGLHLSLTIIAQMGGFAGGALFVMMHMEQINALGINIRFAVIGSAILGVMLPRLIFKFLIPAQCPECGERSIFHGGRPITYHCKSCGHIHRTSVSEGKTPNVSY
jgi:hypothetical protein